MKRSLVLHVPAVDEVFRNVGELLDAAEAAVAMAAADEPKSRHHVKDHGERFGVSSGACRCAEFLAVGEACGAVRVCDMQAAPLA